MPTKLEERKAFKRLRDAFPGEYITLTSVYCVCDNKYLSCAYHAYRSGNGGVSTISNLALTPLEAVDNLLKATGKLRILDLSKEAFNGASNS
jgi:hypothetical protein